MPEQRLPTLVDAQRQVWVRSIIGGLLIWLPVIVLVLLWVKDLYLSLPYNPFLSKQGKGLRGLIDSLLGASAVLAWLWRAIPPWQPRPIVPTASLWEYLYVLWGTLVVMVLGGLLVRSARARRAQIREFRQEMQREAWRQQAREARGLAPDDRGTTPVIGQYVAPPESWSQTPRGIVILGLIVALVGGLIVAFIQLYAEYSYFQVRWPSSRN